MVVNLFLASFTFSLPGLHLLNPLFLSIIIEKKISCFNKFFCFRLPFSARLCTGCINGNKSYGKKIFPGCMEIFSMLYSVQAIYGNFCNQKHI